MNLHLLFIKYNSNKFFTYKFCVLSQKLILNLGESDTAIIPFLHVYHVIKCVLERNMTKSTKLNY